MNWTVIDNEMTPWRKKVKDLQTQLGSGNSEDCFSCEHFPKCKESVDSNADIRKGDWTYVGRQYGKALINGKKARILFVSMERPWDGTNRWQDFKDTQKDFREGAYTRSNPHMGGVDAELTYLLDKTTSPADRCQQFALTNAVRCVSYFHNSDAQSTLEMQKNCSNHTKEIIQVLKPDIIIAQGRGNPCESMRSLFSFDIEKKYREESTSVEIVEIGKDKDGRIFLLTPHPAFYTYPDNSFKWKWNDLPTDSLEKAFKQAREIYLGN
ncbi:MAG: hypothetical protein OXI24_13985 [Candidatus Poribacteria bacterium]|nr:hypothetical protein [Candidatus Poribacteria bacterium]